MCGCCVSYLDFTIMCSCCVSYLDFTIMCLALEVITVSSVGSFFS